MTIDREWVGEALQALADRDGGGEAKRWQPMVKDLAAALQADPLTLGIRPDADDDRIGEALTGAKDAPDPLAVLAERLAVRIPEAVDLPCGPDPPTARDWLIEGWLPAGRIGLLSGEGSAGKSRLALQLACAIAAGGEDWLPASDGKAAIMGAADGEARPAVLAGWEDEPDELDRRWWWLQSDRGSALRWASADRIGGRLRRLDLRRLGSVWGPPAGQHVSTVGGLTDAGAAVRQHCEAVGARLLVLDPLAAAFAGNENDRGLVRAFMADWDGWASASGCAVLLIGHPPKSEAAYSGSTDWRNAARFLWELTAVPSGLTLTADGRIEAAKGKGADAARAMRLRLGKSNYRTGSGMSPECWLRRRGSGPGWEQCTARESAEWLAGLAAPEPPPSEDDDDETLPF